MGNIFQNIGAAITKAANQGEDVAKNVFKQILENPELAILGPVGLGVAGLKNLSEGRNLFGRAGSRPHRTGQAPPMPSGGVYGPGKLSGLLAEAMSRGKTIAGTQPYSVTSYFGAASATGVTKNTDIADMFASANTPAFSVSDTFPWSFQSYRMRWNYTSVLGILTTTNAATAASPGDPTWVATLYAVFSNATEIARVALNNLGLKQFYVGAQGFVATTAAAFGVTVETQPGVLWPVFYDKTGTYAMSFRTQHAIGTTFHPYQISSEIDGWVINDTQVLQSGANQIQATLDELMDSGYGANQVSIKG